MTAPAFKEFNPALMTTGIGSLPFTDAAEAVRFTLESGVSIPFWPQLPRRGFREQMIPQFSEGMPCVDADEQEERMVFDPAKRYEHLERFYENYMKEDLACFAVSGRLAAGLEAFHQMAAGKKWSIVKGQVTGPITFCTGITDSEGNTLYADEELRDAAVKLLVRKAQRQVEELSAYASDRVMVFVDEPVLAAFGSSAYMGIGESEVIDTVGEVLNSVTQAGAIAGMHVCGNSDWGVMIRAGVQVLNFDAYQYGETMALYPEDVSSLLERGGSIAWGVVPTTDQIRGVSVDSLAARFEECIEALVKKGFERHSLIHNSLLTPSCGAGSMERNDAERVFELLRELRLKLTN